HRGGAVLPQRSRPADQRPRHGPVRAAGSQSRTDHGGEPRLARLSLLLRSERLPHTLSPIPPRAIPTPFIAEPGARHCAALGAAAVWDCVGARHPPDLARLLGRLPDLSARGGRDDWGPNRRYGKQWIDAHPTDWVTPISRLPSAQQTGPVKSYMD